MSQSDPRTVVWIAILLAALQGHPRDRSTASYLRDLQSHFPVATKDDESRDWRTYALELEKQLKDLQARRDADQELLSKLSTDASQVVSTSDAPPPKKKSKKNDKHDPEWSWDQSRADWSRFLSSQYPSSPSLVAAYGSLKGALAAPNADSLSYASRLADAVLRALDTTHLFLFSPPHPSRVALTQTTLGKLQPEHTDSMRITFASPLLMYVLKTALQALVRTAQVNHKSKRPCLRQSTTVLATDLYAHVDRVIDRLLECILLPLLRVLPPLCSARLAPLVSLSVKKDKVGRGGGKGKKKEKDSHPTNSIAPDPPNKADVRTDVFALIGTSLEALDALPHLVPGTYSGENGNIARGVRDRLGLEAIRELEALYAAPSSPVQPRSSLQPSSQPPPVTLSEPPTLLTPTPTPAPLSGPSQPQPQPTTRLAQHRSAPESRTKLLERLAGTRTERVRALATRDAGWFLASTLNLCVTPPAPALGSTLTAPKVHDQGKTEHLGDLLRDSLLDRIGKLIRSVNVDMFGEPPSNAGSGTHTGQLEPPGGAPLDEQLGNTTNSKLTIDPVCQNMLLAICERALGQLAPS